MKAATLQFDSLWKKSLISFILFIAIIFGIFAASHCLTCKHNYRKNNSFWSCIEFTPGNNKH